MDNATLWIRLAVTGVLVGLLVGLVGVDLMVIGVTTNVPTLLLISSLYVVTASVALLLVAIWKPTAPDDGNGE